ncbi:MAG: acyl-CoA dehydrogenase C-terminal domain-containing protein, partial [Deltaproteobacteria bacterium]
SALAAKPFLELFGDMIVGWQLLWQATIAHEKAQALFHEKGATSPGEQAKLARENSDAAYYTGKIATAKFFAHTTLCLIPAKTLAIKEQDAALLELAEECFGSS